MSADLSAAERRVLDAIDETELVATLVEVGPLGHAWSGGAAQLRFSNPNGPDASRMAWSFATKQFRLQESAPRLTTVRSKVPVVRKSG